MSICTITLETCLYNLPKTLTLEWKFLFNTTWANYSVSSYLNFIPICWNVLNDWNTILCISLCIIFPCTLTAKYIIVETTAQIPEIEYGGNYGHMRANTNIWGQIRIIDGQYGYLPSGQITNTDIIIGHSKTNVLHGVFF